MEKDNMPEWFYGMDCAVTVVVIRIAALCKSLKR